MQPSKTGKKVFNNPLFSSRIKSANVKPKEALIGYFVGPFLAFISNAIFGSYLNKYFNNVLGMTSYSALFGMLMPILSAILVVVCNVVVGQLIENTRTSAGKARPYLLFSLPFIAIAIVLLFIGPKTNSVFQLIWIAVSYNLYYAIAFPLFYTSHSSMVGLSTRNSKSRGLLSTFSNASVVAAVGLGASIIFPLFQGFLFVTNDKGIVDISASYSAWRIFMLILVALSIIGIILEYYFTRERITEENIKLDIKQEKLPILKQLRAVVSSKDWWIVMVYFLLFQFGGLIKNGSMTYYADAMFGAKTSGEAGGFQSLLGLLGGIPTAIGMVLAWPLAAKLGKKNSMVIGFIISIFGGLVSFINVNNFALVCTGVVLKGIGSIPAMYVSLALLADVLDHLEAKFSFRCDGLTMSIYGAIMVGLAGIGTGVVNALLGAGGYVFNQIGGQTETAQNMLVWCYLIIELICYAILAVLLLFTKVEKGIKKDHEIIIANQKEAVLAKGGEWIEPSERLRLEQAEADFVAEEALLEDLRKKCDKKGLDFQLEKSKHQAKIALKLSRKHK